MTNVSTPIEKAWLRLRLTERRSEQIEILKRQRLEIQSLIAKLREDQAKLEVANEARRLVILDWADSSKKALLKFESCMIREALRVTNGRIYKAARLLGMSYQGLGYAIKTRHRELLAFRSEVWTTRKSRVNHE